MEEKIRQLEKRVEDLEKALVHVRSLVVNPTVFTYPSSPQVLPPKRQDFGPYCGSAQSTSKPETWNEQVWNDYKDK